MNDKDQLNTLLQKTLQKCYEKEKLYGSEVAKESYNRFFILLDVQINHKKYEKRE
ncbi:hypothetical protein [Metabacillus halosaccharovorans]|uniref:hypothetical protein n=1 Tax=Metabacillus halosaccharovorans TaxID=930124 RepID=UPI002041C4C5|nr:hypothetical protein [Metabacillus halosaccharovorans]MCM3444365.1 hypothetical protein [Metabacillus halosaccharovorans]